MERLLFAGGAGYYAQSEQFWTEQLRTLEYTEAQLDRFFYRNAARLLGLA